jgi:hypothetical protein
VITLSITPPEGLTNDTLVSTFCTSDVNGLREMVSECKRLKVSG